MFTTKHSSDIKNIIGTEGKNIIYINQVHGDNVIKVSEFTGKITDADGVMTDNPQNILITKYADCVPLYFYDINKHIIASVHSGWKGTYLKIGEKAVYKMKENYGSDPENIICAIGPSIGPENFEIGEEVYLKIKSVYTDEDLYKKNNSNKFIFNLWEANRRLLVKSGIKEKNIITAAMCTYEMNDMFFSYRRENGNTGRMSALIYFE
ncbi:MAG: peptidoglycan editing factor PgeF [Thermotogae bacterium]|nr:peptidoglycan editing factor PgeF [Thermotogota bacterium]MCP5465061.1 peptidoglycan editing factor PgeF [Thermotogota bacterium]